MTSEQIAARRIKLADRGMSEDEIDEQIAYDEQDEIARRIVFVRP